MSSIPTSSGAPIPSSPTAAGPPAGAGAGVGATAGTQSTTKALEDLSNAAPAAGGSILDSIQGFVDRVSVQAQPYLDNAGVKVDQFIDRIEGSVNSMTGTTAPGSTTTTAPVVSSTTTLGSSSIGEKSVTKETVAAVKDTAQTAGVHAHAVGITAGAHASAVANTASANASAVAATVSEKAKGIFAAVQSNFEQLTHTIDEKTASPDHPGLITQITQGAQKAFDKVDQALSEPQTVGGAPAVQTTTNSIPHEAGAAASTSSAPVVPVVGATGFPAAVTNPAH